MTTNFRETIVISIGGSLLVPESIDSDFIKKLKEIIKSLVEDNYQVALVVGGGKTARIYQAAARNFDNVTNTDLDWIGIKSIRLNCELMLRIFSDLSVHNNVIEKWEDASEIKESVIIIGAWEPGCSSDKDAVELAGVLNGKSIVNFSNITHVYDSDPNKNPDAKKLEKLSWDDYIKIIPDEWTPGLSSPFDPVASRLAKQKNIEVVVIGASLENLENYLNGREFEGTTLS